MKNFIIALLALVAIVVFSSLFVIKEGERGIVFQFSKIQRDAAGSVVVFEPGLHFKLPLIENVRILDAKVQTLDDPADRFVTAEKKDLLVDSYVKWRIKDFGKYFLSTTGRTDRADDGRGHRRRGGRCRQGRAGDVRHQHAAGLRIKSHMPNPMRIFNFTSRDNAHTGASEVSDPAFEHTAKSVNERLPQIQTGHHVEAFASLPIAILCSVLNDIQVDTAQGNAALLEQFPQTAKATFKRMTFHCFVIGSHHGAIFQNRYFLGSEKQLCGPGF